MMKFPLLLELKKPQRHRSAFTLVELIVSTGLFIVAVSIALFAVIGSAGLIQKNEARGAVSEGARSVVDSIKRATENAPIGAVSLSNPISGGSTFAAVRAKKYSAEQSGVICTTIGRANTRVIGGEEQYDIDQAGTSIAIIVHSVDLGGLCPSLGTAPIYQNRLSSNLSEVKGLQFFIQTIACQTPSTTCITKQFLRYSLDIQQIAKATGLADQSRSPSISLISGLPIGLVNESTSALTIETSTLADGMVGQSYSQALAASGGIPGYTWTKIAGTWPPGAPVFSLSPDGIIAGTPNTTLGSPFSFTVQLEDSTHTIKTKVLSIAVYNALSITTVALSPATATIGTPYTSAAITTNNGGKTPYTWSLTGNPAWMSINSSGVISGTPDASGTINFTVQVTDSFNPTPNVATKALQLVVSAGSPLSITTASPLPNAMVNCAYSQQLSATGGTPGYTWVFTGLKPFPLSWLQLSSGGLLTSSPNPGASGGPYTFSVKVTDSVAGTAIKSFTITIDAFGGVCGAQGGGSLGEGV